MINYSKELKQWSFGELEQLRLKNYIEDLAGIIQRKKQKNLLNNKLRIK
jgi:hypothetical protein